MVVVVADEGDLVGVLTAGTLRGVAVGFLSAVFEVKALDGIRGTSALPVDDAVFCGELLGVLRALDSVDGLLELEALEGVVVVADLLELEGVRLAEAELAGLCGVFFVAEVLEAVLVGVFVGVGWIKD